MNRLQRAFGKASLYGCKTVAERRGEPCEVLHSESHRWFCYPAMSRDEAPLFLHDDARSGSIRTLPHTAFEDPQRPANAEPRASVEMRVLSI